MASVVIQLYLWGIDMSYDPQVGDICILTTIEKEDRISKGEKLLTPCFVEVEYQNDYCWLVRYKDSEQCNMVRKSDKRYLFKEAD